MSSLHGKPDPQRAALAVAFTRSLNILLKYVRLYGFEHIRSTSQFNIAWDELQQTLHLSARQGLMLGVAGSQLLLEGMPLEGAAAEKSFAQLLSAAGIASLQFTPETTAADFACLIRGFIFSGSKARNLGEQLQAALQDCKTIQMNRVKFVAEDANSTGSANVSAILAAAAFGDSAGSLHSVLNDPSKLLQAIAAANSGASSGVGSGAAAAAQPARQAEVIPFPSELMQVEPVEDGPASPGADFAVAVRMLTRFGATSRQPEAAAHSGHFHHELAQMPQNVQASMHEVLSQIAAMHDKRPDTPLLLQLAEQLAIRYALERFERGDVKVNAVHEMLQKMSKEMESLRGILNAHEKKMERMGMMVESHADILDQQFWAKIPDGGKRTVLTSPDAWCIPPRNVASYVTELMERGDGDGASKVLLSYAGCIHSKEAEGRRATALGLTQIAELYGKSGSLLEIAIAQVGERLGKEEDPTLQKLMSAAFVRLSQEAAGQKKFAGLRQAVRELNILEAHLPGMAEELRPRIGVYERLPEFIEEAIAAPRIPADLMEVLRSSPHLTIEKLAQRFGQSSRRSECDRAAEIAIALGTPARKMLTQKLHSGQPGEAVTAIGLLSRLDLPAMEAILLERIKTWGRPHQSAAIAQLSLAGSPARSSLLLRLLPRVDALVKPEVVDELGMTGDHDACSELTNLAFSQQDSSISFLQLKSIEALGRLHESGVAQELKDLISAKQMWSYAFPRELRVTAAQALRMIDPKAEIFLSQNGVTETDLSWAALDTLSDCPWVRQRRYPRTIPTAKVSATVTTSRSQAHVDVQSLSLGGGAGSSDNRFQAGTHGTMEIQAGLRKVRAQVLVREQPTRELSFEIVGMDINERAKLRGLLAGAPWEANLIEQLKSIPLPGKAS
ncbi:MAG: PilZ domain-containing protein [Terriglobales bacterium]